MEVALQRRCKTAMKKKGERKLGKFRIVLVVVFKLFMSHNKCTVIFGLVDGGVDYGNCRLAVNG